MNWIMLILALVPTIVKGIQTVIGDKASGASKSQMAHDALAAAVNGTSQILTGNNAVYGEAAAQIAQVAIDQTVALAKQQGAYAKWTAVAAATNAVTNTAAQVAAEVLPTVEPEPAPEVAPEVHEADAPGVAHN